MRLNYKNTKQLVVGLAVTTALTGCGNPDGVYHVALEWFGARTQYKNPIPPSSQIQAIHNAAPFIVDLHADTLLHPDAGGDDGYRLLVNEEREGHVDINRMIEGNVAMEVFAAASKGSLDIAGDTIPWITGYYTDDDGVEHSRYNYVRDPNVWEYDDEHSPYAEHYASVSMERDLATYFYRVSGMPCTTWYEDGGVETYTAIDSLNQYTEALICEKTWWKTNSLDNPFTVEEAYKILGGNSLELCGKSCHNNITYIPFLFVSPYVYFTNELDSNQRYINTELICQPEAAGLYCLSSEHSLM